MDKIKDFYDVVFKGFTENDGWLNRRKILQGGGAKNFFHKDIQELISSSIGQKDMYYAVAVRKDKDGGKKAALYSNIMFIDVDFHDDKPESWSSLKNKILMVALDDPFLSQFFAVVDSGRGLHFYYQLPKKTFVSDLKLYYSRLVDYASGVLFLKEYLDGKVTEIARILRCPGSINSKTGTTADILAIDPDKQLDETFMKYLDIEKSPEKHKSSFSVSQAMQMVGMEVPTSEVNIPCPFPGHTDSRPSFKYYADSDTFWCFKCSSEDKNMYNGIHFLTLMERPELIAELKANSDIKELDGYKLDKAGKMYKTNKDGEDKIICNFMSSSKIEVSSQLFGRMVYIDFGDTVVDITDYPSNREIKRRYLQTNREFLLNVGESGFSDILTRFIRKADNVERNVVFNHGLNFYDDAPTLFHINGQTFPRLENEPVTTVEPLDIPVRKVKYDMSFFVDNLIKDNNYSHLIGLAWGIATIARDIIIGRGGLFPLLVATGIRESGKTQLARMVINMFGYDRSEEMDTTSFAMIKKLERYGSLPVHFDEFSQKKREQEHEELLKDLSTSKVAIRERGNISQRTDKYILQCPVIITGEKNIKDAGIVSRSIILNLGKSPNKNKFAFNNWVGFFKEGRLMSFFLDFLDNHFDRFREFFTTCELSRYRNDIKKEVVLLTLDYLEKHNLIPKVNREPIKALLKDTDLYKDSISSDGYTEILSELLTDNFEPTKRTGDYKITKILDSFYFDIEENIILVNTPSLFEAYKISSKDAYRNIPSVTEFRLNFIQAPDMCGFLNKRKRIIIEDLQTNQKIERRLSELVAIRVSPHNFEYMRLVLLYKLFPKFEGDLETLYITVDNLLEEMANTDKGFVDTKGTYVVL